MPVCVAKYTLELSMRSCGGFHAFHWIRVTSCAEAVWNIRAIGNILGHMGVMTLHALSIVLERRMRLFMTFSTRGFVTMLIMMTGSARHIGMSAWMLFYLLCLL